MIQTLRWYFTAEDVVFPKFIDNTKSKLFIISNFTLESEEKIKIKWTFWGLPVGFIEIECTEEVHPQYGSSYNVVSYKHYIPFESEGVMLYLKKFFKLSDRQAAKVYDLFDWKDVLQRLVPEMNKVLELKGLFTKSEKYAQFEKLCTTHMEWSEVRYFLYEYWVNERQVREVITKFWNIALSKIKENPYNLLKVSGIGFKTADSVFLQFWYDRKDERRILASLYYVIQEFCEKNKSLYIFQSELLKDINYYLWLNGSGNRTITKDELDGFLNRRNLGTKDYDETLDATIYKDLKVLTFWERNDRVVFIYKYYEWETETAIRVISALNSKEITKYNLTDEEFDNGSKPLNAQQKEAIQNCFNNKISIIRGYGGTGKSTIIKKIIDKCKKENLSYTLLAPTGKAVDVLIWITEDSSRCSTIHRKLGLKNEWDLPEEIICEDVIIIDESSMMALPLFYSLLNWVPNLSGEKNRKIVLVGDDNQLPPIWLWKPFLDLINLKAIPEVKLFQIYRQKEDSLILENSKKVIEYSNDPVDSNLLTLDKTTSDWKTYNTGHLEDTEVKDLILRLISENTWDEDNDVILTAQYKWDCGISALNSAMQTVLNTNNQYFFKWGFHLYYLGERVMHVNENWYRDAEKSDEREVYPINMITNWKNLKVLEEISSKYSNTPKDKIQETQGIFAWYGSSVTVWLDVVFNWRTQNIEVNGMIVWTYRDWELKIVNNPNISEKNGTVDRNVYNGNWGKVVAVKTQDGWYGYNDITNRTEYLPFSKLTVPWTNDKEEYVLFVDFGDKIIAYTQDRLERVTLFYAASVHKSQGSQFGRVYSICLPSSSFLVDKYWLYTLLSRGVNEVYYFSTPEFTRQVQLKCNLEKKRGIFVDYFNYNYQLTKK